MITKRAATFGLLNLVFLASYSQEIKYADLCTLLKTGQYKQSEPILKRYLKNNPSEPSANFYMAMIFEDKIGSSTEQGKLQTHVDSALYFYDQALKLISQREIRKNQAYYSRYERRSLSTGKFEVKLSDIQLDIEARKGNLTTLSRALGLPMINKLIKNNQRVESDKKEPGAPPPLKKANGQYYAVIIGVATYDSSGLNLDSPIKDAQELKSVLTSQYEFEESNIYALQNPTRQQIIISLFSLRKKITSIDNLLIFYAGHGYWDADVEQGYWWPRDASPVNPTNWLSNSDIREQIRGIKSAHTLLVSDACFSGGIFKVRSVSSIREAPLDIISLYKLPSRRAITSGTLTQVPDKSIFFKYFIKRLNENQERFLTSQSLFDSFKKAVINNSFIVPQDGVIADTGDEGGDFIFIKRTK